MDVQTDADGTFWVRPCPNSICRVLDFKWRKPGDSCPSCGWG